MRILLHVPYEQKNEASALGAKWDKEQKSWYVPDGIDIMPFTKWISKEELKTILDSDDKVPTNIPISEEIFPDLEFRRYLSENYDRRGTGVLIVDNILSVQIDTDEYHVKSLEGISQFQKLTFLKIANNGGTILLDGVENLHQLNILEIANCGVSELNVSGMPFLEVLDCSNNNLSDLDVSGNADLKILYCNDNKISEVDVRNNEFLKCLDVRNCSLSSLDVSGNSYLKFLDFRGAVANVDLSRNTELQYLNGEEYELEEEMEFEEGV